MAKGGENLPENSIIRIAENANIQIHNNKGTIRIPLYVDRLAQVNEPRGFLKIHLPNMSEVQVSIEIPFKDNITNENVSLTEAMMILNKASGALSELYGKDVKIEDHIVNGNQVKITGTYSNKV